LPLAKAAKAGKSRRDALASVAFSRMLDARSAWREPRGLGVYAGASTKGAELLAGDVGTPAVPARRFVTLAAFAEQISGSWTRS
jgi:hypothetical protein